MQIHPETCEYFLRKEVISIFFFKSHYFFFPTSQKVGEVGEEGLG